MPIVVDEVVISVEVSGHLGEGTPRGGAMGSGGGPETDRTSPYADRQLLIAECVERVLDVLARREEP